MANVTRNSQNGRYEKRTAGGLKWFNNVAKSLGYTSTELISQIAPSMAEFTETNVTYAKELAQDARNLRSAGNKFKSAFNANSHVGILKEAMKNAMSDLKTGNLYNVERQRQVAGGDFDFDDSEFTMVDFGVDESSTDADSKVVVPKVNVNVTSPPITPDNPLVKAMTGQIKATYVTAQAMNDSNVKIAQNTIAMNHAMHGRTLQGLQTINDNVGLLVNFQNDSMSKYIGASLKYYEENLKIVGETLEEIRKQGTSNQDANRRPAYEGDPADDAFLMNGGLNVKGYLGMVKSNFRKQMSENPMLAPIKAIFEDESTLKYLAASPLSFISTKIVTTLLPQYLQQSLGQLDKTFSNFFPAMFMRFNRETLGSSNPLLQMVGEIFGINLKNKNNIDLSRYNKGAVPFDGVTRKTINEVIPGYLRKMLAALTGTKEVAFDHDQGKFKSVETMQTDFNNRRDSLIKSAFNDSIDELRQIAETFPIESRKDREALMGGIEKFVVNLANSQYSANPRRTRDREGNNVDELKDIYDFGGNSDMQRLFRQMVLSMNKSSQTKMFGYNVVDAKRQVRNMMSNAEMNPEMDNVTTLFNELGFDQHVDKKTDGSFTVRKGKGILNPTDKFGFGQLDYLRDIKRILAHGIRVFMGNAPKTSRGPRGGQGPNPNFNPHDGVLNRMGTDESTLIQEEYRNNQDVFDTFSNDAKIRMSNNGQRPLSGLSDLSTMSDDEIARTLRARQDIVKNNNTQSGKRSPLDFIGGLLSGNSKETFDSIRSKVDDLLKKPAELMQGIVAKIDNSLYKLVFGGDDENTPSFAGVMMARMRESFSKFFNWGRDKILTPLNESLFGKEGMITKLKDSDLMKSIKGKIKNVGDFLFGKPTGANGKREGGLFGDVGNNFSDMWSGVKYYFNGKGYTNHAGITFADNDKSVFSEIKGMFGGFKTDMRTYLFGKKDEKGERTESGVLGGALDTLKQGFFNFGQAIFGPKMMKGLSAETASQKMIEKIKARAPKSIAGGIVGAGAGLVMGGGLLGTLVGGPMGAAIIGSAVAYLSQSEKFKNMMFGERDATGERIGGMINKSTQDFFKKNRVGIIGGASLGAVKAITGFGILPSFLLPGGPIGGVALGIGASMLYRSEAFQKMMFGEKDADGKRVGGIIQKAFGSNPQGKKIMGNVGAGVVGGAGLGLLTSKLGIMGAMLVPGGPIGGAILGAAAGIALSSDRWKKALFGDFDEESGKRKGGLLGKFQNWFKIEVMKPIQLQFQHLNLQMKDWFTEKIGNPFREAIAPIKKEFQNMFNRMADMFKNGWDSFKEKIGDVFEKHVGQPFGIFMKEKVLDPLKRFFSGIIKGVGKVFGFVLQSPIKALSAVSEGLTERHKKQGLKGFIEDERADMYGADARRQRKERGEKLGMFSNRDVEGNVIGPGLLKRTFNMHFDKKTRDAARTSSAGADYLHEPAISPEELKLQKEKRDQAWAELNHRKKILKMAQKMGLKADYDNFDSRGNDISRIYDTHERITKLGQVSDHDRTMLSTIGVDLSQLIPGADMNNLNKKQKKKLTKMISEKLNTGVLKNPFADQSSGEDEVVGAVDKVGDDITDQTDKITSAIKDSSPKDEIKDHLIPAVKETNSILHKLLSSMDKGKINVQRTFRSGGSFKSPGTGPNSIYRALRKMTGKDPGSHADGIDNVPEDEYPAMLHQGEMVIPADPANEIRKRAGMGTKPASQAGTGEVSNSNRLVMGKLGRDKESLLSRIASDVRIIASEVRGQLDGLGGNVYKIRKLVQKGMGASDDDISGSANRDRVGLFGKFRRMLFKPFEAIQNQLMKGVDWVTGKIRAFGNAIKKVGDFIIGIPVKIGKAMWDFTKNVGAVIKEGAMTLVKIPVQIGKLALAGMQVVVESVKAVGPAIAKSLMGVASLFAGIMKGAGSAIAGFGKGLGNFFTKVGEGAGKVVVELGIMGASLTKNIGKLITGVAKTITDFTLGAIHSAVDFTLGTVKMLSEKLLDVGNSLLQLVTSPIKFLAAGIGKGIGMLTGPKEVKVVGGHLDSIGTIGSKVETGKSAPPTRVIVAGAENGFAATVSQIFKKLFPIPVTMQQAGTPGRSSKITGGLSAVLPQDSTGAIGGMIGSAIKKIDDQNDKDRKNEKDEADRKEKFSKVSFRTADYMKGKIAEIEEKEFVRDSTNKQISLLDKIRSAVTEHKDGWMAIFGPKGLLTAAAIMALPFIKKIWDALANFFNKGNNGEGNQSGTSAMNNALKYGAQKLLQYVPANKVVQGGKAIATATKGAFEYVTSSKPVQMITEAGSKVVQKVTQLGTDIANSKVGQAVSKVANTVTAPAVKAAEVIETGSTKVMTAIKNFFEKVINHPKVAQMLGSKAATVVKSILGALAQFGKNPEFISKMLGGLAKGTAKIAASASTAGVLEAGFAIWNATTGFINKGDAAYLFNVYENEVTPKMRLVSSIMKTILGVSYIFILELLNAVVVQITGGKINVLLMIANSFYKAISDEDAYDDLSQAQIQFETDATEAGYTKSAWNEKNNKTFETKVVDFTKKYWPTVKEGSTRLAEFATPLGMINAAKDSFSDATVRKNLGLGEGTDLSFGQRLSVFTGSSLSKMTMGLLDSGAASQAMANSGQWLVDKGIDLKNFTVNGLNSIGKGISNVAGNIKDGAMNMVSNIKDGAVNIWNSDQVKTLRNIVSGVHNAVSNVAKAVGSALAEIGGALWDRMKKFGVWMKDKFTEGKDFIAKKWDEWFVTPFKLIGEWFSGKWNETTDWVKEQWDTWVGTPLKLFGSLVKTKFDAAKDLVAEKWDKWVTKPMSSAMNAVGKAWKVTKKWVGEKWEKYIGKPMADAMQVVSDGWDATRGWINEQWQTYVVDPAKRLIDGVKTLWDNITNLVNNAWDYVTGGVSDAWNNTVDKVKSVASDTTNSIATGWNNFWGTNAAGFKDKVESGSTNVSGDIKDLGSQIASAIRGEGGPKYDYNGSGGPAYGGDAGNGRTPVETSQKVFNGFRVTSQFGLRADPFDKSARAHNGIDLVKPDGSPIGAFMGGRVVYAGMGKPGTGYNNMGNVVAVKDGNGATHIYAHLSSIATRVGDQVQAGQVVGTQGSTGRSTGSHLHYEVRSGGYGTSIDPTQYIMNKGFSTIPGVTNSGAAAMTQNAVENPELTTLDLFSKMSENFSLYADNVFTGQNKAFSLTDGSSGDITSAVGSPGSQSVTLSGFKPLDVKNFTPAMQQSIAQKAVEMVIQGEGGRIDSVTKDYEPGSRAPRGMSLGLMQWNRGRAKQMVQQLAATVPGAGFERFAGDPSLWGTSWWPDSQIQQFKNLINQNSAAANKVQQSMISSDVMSRNLSPIFSSGKLRDPRSIVMLSDIGNTGPAHISSFLNSYTPAPAGQAEFPHFYDELKRKSWWSRHLGVYGGRLDKTFNSLQGWNPSGFTSGSKGGQGGPAGPVIRKSDVKMPAFMSSPNNSVIARSSGNTIPSLVGKGYTDSYRSMMTNRVSIEGGNNTSLMAEMVSLLKEISGHTGNTSQGIIDLNAKENTVNIVNADGTPAEQNPDSVAYNVNSGGSSANLLINKGGNVYNTNPMIQSMNDARTARASAEYKKAKAIASGGRV